MSSPTKVAVLAINAVELDAGQLAAQRRSSPQQLHADAAAGRLTLQTVAAEQGVLEGIIIAQEASDVVAPGSSVAAPSGGACTLDDADIYCHETDEALATESHIAAEQAESVSMMCPRRSFNERTTRRSFWRGESVLQQPHVQLLYEGEWDELVAAGGS